MKATWATAVALTIGCAAPAIAATATWKSSVSSGAWHTSGNWDRSPANQPQPGDTVHINSGTQIFWGGSYGGMHSNIRDNSHVTVNGGNVQFQGNYGVNIGAGGSGSASSLTVTSGSYNMSGDLNVGNASGETGTLNVGPSGTFDAGTLTWVRLHPTGTINSSGTVVDVGDLDLLGGVVNINGGSFTINRVKFESSGATGNKVNIAGGTLTVTTVSAIELGWGNRYFNFTSGSTGALRLANVSPSAMATYLDNGYVRVNGTTSPSSFTVAAYGASGSQVSLASGGGGGGGPTATWKSSVSSGSWHTSSNWDRSPANQPQPGDTVHINSGTQQFWGGSFGGMHSNIRDNSHVTVNGGNVQFQGNYGANIGAGGNGTASSLTVTSGSYNMSGTLTVGNASGETGTLDVGPNGTFDAGTLSWVRLFATGTINSSGTIVDVGDLDLLGGVLNVNGGSFTANRVIFENNGATGNKLNIAGGTLTVSNVSTTELGWGNRYFNFTSGSTGTLRLTNVSTSTMSTFLNNGYVRLNGATSPGSFTVSAYGASGSQVSLASSGGGGGPGTFIPQQYTPLLTNTGFENGETDWLTQYAQLQSTHVAGGSNAGYVNAASFYLNWPIRHVSVQVGKYYRFRAKLSTVNMQIAPGFGLRFFDGSGDTIQTVWIGNETLVGTTPYREFVSPNIRVPAGTASASIYIGLAANSGGTFYYDDVILEEVTTLPLYAVPTFTSVGVHISKANAPSGEVAKLFYRKQGTSTWLPALDPVYDATRGEYRGSIVGLDEDSNYEVQAQLKSGSTTTAEAGVLVRTWASSVPIATTYNVSTLYSGSGQLKLENMHGSPTGWIRVVGTGNNDVNGGYNTTPGADNVQAVLIKNCSYLLFENVHVTGGRRHGIEVRNSDSIRISRCEITGWARQPNVYDDGVAYESAADVTANNPINNDAAVYLKNTTRVTVERCYMHDPRLGANSWVYGHPNGPNALFVENTLATGNSVVRYNDMIGGDTLRWNDAIEGYGNEADFGSFCRDSDIYGNMFAFGNDDGIEVEGGQTNLRIFNNRFESFYIGISVAPNKVGPSYIYRNLVFNLGDQNDGAWSMVKAGGGTTYSKGKSFFFNNTMYAAANGLAGVGYGSDANRTMFMAMSRNNIFFSTHDHNSYRNAISDSSPNPWSTFDYDNLASITLPSAQVQYATGQEAHGKLNQYPTFVDAAGGDFRLASGSSAINGGVALPNFAATFAGSAPDQGAFEVGASSLMPSRPVAISASKYLVTLTATANGSSSSASVTVNTGNLGGATAYTVRKNSGTGWLNVTPTSGTLQNNSNQTFTFSVATAGLPPGQREATVLVRLANGYSVPITVVANVN